MDNKVVINSLHSVAGNADMLRELVLQFAANSPEEFMKAFERLDFSDETLKTRVNAAVKNLPCSPFVRNAKVDRVRAHRLVTGSGLLEAKIWVEANYSDNGNGV